MTNHTNPNPDRCCPHGFMDHVAPENLELVEYGLFPLDCMDESCPCNGLTDFEQWPVDADAADAQRELWGLLGEIVPRMLNAPWN